MGFLLLILYLYVFTEEKQQDVSAAAPCKVLRSPLNTTIKPHKSLPQVCISDAREVREFHEVAKPTARLLAQVLLRGRKVEFRIFGNQIYTQRPGLRN